MPLTPEQKKLWDNVDEILWEDWDPIGVNSHAPRDEYQSYIPAIFRLLLNRSSVSDISAALFKIETEAIGLPGDQHQCDTIAQKLTEAAGYAAER